MDAKLEELKRLKAQRSRQRELRDLEERMLLDNLDEMERTHRGERPTNKARSKLQLSKSKDIRNMQIQYERRRERDLHGLPKKIYTKADAPKYNPQADPKVQQLAETHGRQMQYLSDRNRDLERQRDEIRRRLEELGRRPIKDDDSMNALLQELREQEARNQKLLEELRRQLMEARYVPPQEAKKNPYIYPVYYGNSLVAEITAMRQAYLQNGGNDPDILHQLAQMLAEAQAIDESLRNRPAPVKNKKDHNDALLALELENERLKRQLQFLQEQNVAAKQRRKDDREGRPRLKARTSIDTKRFNYQPAPGPLITPVAPLDLDIEKILKSRSKIKVKKSPRIPLRSWTTFYDPLKAKIDRDVGNTAFKVTGRKWEEEGSKDDDEEPPDMTNVPVKTILKEPTQDTVDLVQNKPFFYKEEKPQPSNQDKSYKDMPPVNVDIKEYLNKDLPKSNNDTLYSKNQDMPYYKNHLASQKLNNLERESYDRYSYKSQPHLKRDDVDRSNLLSAIRESPNQEEPLTLNLPHSSRTVDDTNTDRSSGPKSKPQLIKETNPT